MSTDSLFLHFINRELMFLRKEKLDEAAHISLIKRAGLMTSGYLSAPFAQVHETYWKKPKAIALISALCGEGKLCITNSSSDFYTFVESRRELYGSRREKYPMYFGKKEGSSAHYTRSPSLDTTRFIKSALLNAVNQPDSLKNLIGFDEVIRLRENSEFIKEELQNSSAAATFSLFETGQIAPKPKETIFFGRMSSRLFVSHYSTTLDLYVPTGVLNDPLIESYDKFPIYDFGLQRILLEKLDIDFIARDTAFHRPYLNLISDPDFPTFTAQREALIRVLSRSVGSDIGTLDNLNKVGPMLAAMDFGSRRSSQPQSASVLALRVIRALERAATRNNKVAEHMARLGMSNHNHGGVVVFTATDVEDASFKAACAISEYNLEEVTTFSGFTASLYGKTDSPRIWHVRTSAGSAGASGSARISEKALETLKPSFAFAVGIAFSVDDTKTFGTVMVSEYIFSYERLKVRARGQEWRGDKIPCAPEVISLARAYSSIESSFKVEVGGILSGEKLIDRRSFRDKVASLDPKSIGGEMEAIGIAQSCLVLGVRFSMVKGISDFAVGKDDNSQKLAAQNACLFLFDAVNRLHKADTFKVQ